MIPPEKPGKWRRFALSIGFVLPPGGERRPGGTKFSRYGIYTSSRVDQDVDEIFRRLAALEARRDDR